jgi:hypothetical protein
MKPIRRGQYLGTAPPWQVRIVRETVWESSLPRKDAVRVPGDRIIASPASRLQSSRRASTGLTPAARLAGSAAARRATAVMARGAARRVIGSLGETP